MARTPMVTRRLKFTCVDVLCLNIETGEPFNKNVKLSGHYKNDTKLRKIVDKKINTDIEKTVYIVSVEHETKLFGMEEDDFIAHANPLSDDRKIINDPTETLKTKK